MWDRLRKQIQLRVFCTEELFYSANCGICSCTPAPPCNENNINNNDDDDDDEDEDDNDNQDNDENNDNDHNSSTTNIISLQEKNTKIRKVIAF